MARLVQAAKAALAIRMQDSRYWSWYLYHHI
jgi:hypothetical protein